MATLRCHRCDRYVDGDWDDKGIHAETDPWEFLCGPCCDELLDKVEHVGRISDADIVGAYRDEKSA